MRQNASSRAETPCQSHNCHKLSRKAQNLMYNKSWMQRMAAFHSRSTKTRELRQLDGEKLKSKILCISVDYVMQIQAKNLKELACEPLRYLQRNLP
jgi:hypothetical protein